MYVDVLSIEVIIVKTLQKRGQRAKIVITGVIQ